ncbi:S24 family peptidase [Candidatus Kapabacteria bacterium]|nr:S24 family peptidase [Candidatus Kapabacteria bacterium]
MPIELMGFKSNGKSKIPFFTVSVSAGIPVPVDTDESTVIDLNEYLVDHPSSTFFAKITGEDLSIVGIHDSDILIIDTGSEPIDGKMILVMLNEELTVKIFRDIDGEIFFESSQNNFIPRNLPGLNYEMIGVITKIIHSI